MNLFENLKAKYPNNFESCYDFSTGEGWDNIVEKLTDMVIAIEPKIKIVQVKEKFGGLRYYIEHDEESTEEQWKKVRYLIECAEEASERTCEVCGKEGKIVGKNWLSCRCEEHTV